MSVSFAYSRVLAQPTASSDQLAVVAAFSLTGLMITLALSSMIPLDVVAAIIARAG